MVSSGTEETICRLVETYSDMLLRLAATRLSTPTDAEDVVQEVFLYLLERGATFRDAGHEKAWLIRATLHRARNFRKRAENRSVPLEEAALSSPPPDEAGALLTAIRAMPEKYSTVIYLHYYEGYSMKEIAQALGIPCATVGTRLARGRKLLRETLKEDG